METRSFRLYDPVVSMGNTAQYKDLFCSEAEENLATLSRLILEIEKDPSDIERYRTLMRSAHTIKGAAATMGYTEMATLAHALEDLFHAAERGAFTLDPASVSVALSGLDRMSASLASIKEKDQELETGEVARSVLALLAAAPGETTIAAPPKETHVPQGQEQEHLFAYAAPTSIRVDVERLNALMGLFEEMLMLRLKLDTILEPAIEITRSITDPALKQKIYFIDEFKTLFGELARSLSETQTELLRIRLVPLQQLFEQFPRMVRDVALREGKRVEFTVTGGDVALDRTVLDGLGGALAHLLRNAVDHGIATEGTIRLTARRLNDRVHVIVEDTGVGVDYEAVRRVAIERGIIGAEEGARLRKTEIADLLFHQNLSTSPTVTDISGRGVGLSAVRAFAQEVGGRVSVVSPISGSGGTRFILDLPVSLATIEVLLVEASGFTFAIPFTSVIHTITFLRSAIVSSAHQESLLVDGQPLPVLRLSEVLGITFGDRFRKEKTTEGDELMGILISSGGERIVLLVDRTVGEQELLVKSLPPLLRDVKGFAGSTLLPDGRTILLLDTQGLLHQAFDAILEKR
jgi:two-component system chemotaxis sensor kinase CheA